MSFHNFSTEGWGNIINLAIASFTLVTLVVTVRNYRKTTMLTTLSTMSALIKDYSTKINQDMEKLIEFSPDCPLNEFKVFDYSKEFTKIVNIIKRVDKGNTYRDIIESYLSENVLKDVENFLALESIAENATNQLEVRAKSFPDNVDKYREVEYDLLKKTSENYKYVYDFLYGKDLSKTRYPEIMIIIHSL